VARGGLSENPDARRRQLEGLLAGAQKRVDSLASLLAAEQEGESPATKPGKRTRSKPGSQRVTKPGKKPGKKPGRKPGFATGSYDELEGGGDDDDGTQPTHTARRRRRGDERAREPGIFTRIIAPFYGERV